ncbi:MAG: TetR family transcriptional regulator [Sporichthyaceae bacterium]
MPTFQRARSEEQRELRRAAILSTAAAMLDELPVSEVSLNELSRRAGLAKSNVLRYFDSREAILLELLEGLLHEWLVGLGPRLEAAVDADSPARRAEQVAATIAESIADRPVLCDLFSSQAAVLEHNVSVEVAARHKRAAIDDLSLLADLMRRHLPELGVEGALRACLLGGVVIGSLWSHARPSASMCAAYEADPSLAVLRLNFEPALADAMTTILLGVLARATGDPA